MVAARHLAPLADGGLPWLIAGGFALVLSLLAAPVRADSTPSLALEPAPAGDRGTLVERAAISGHLTAAARVFADYAREPLVLIDERQTADAVVIEQMWLHALASFSLFHRLMFNLDVPFVAAQTGAAAPLFVAAAPRAGSGAELGDVRVGARLKLLANADEAESRVELALGSSVWFPTAAGGYTGDGEVRVRLAAILEGYSPRFYWAANAGVKTRPYQELPGALPSRVGNAVTLGLAGGFFLGAGRELALGSELVADLPFEGGAKLFDPRATAAQLLLTGHYRIAAGPFEIGAAFGPGLGQGAGSADYRVLGFFGFVQESAAPPPDEDEDGVPDKSDACARIAGEPSRDPLLNGCPPPPRDKDGDGIPDNYDACPAVPGDATSERKTHGCPRDSDGDAVPDKSDKCPTVAGEKPPEGNGCPKPQPEPTKTALVNEEIVISQKVQFETGTAVLRPESDAVLGEVAAVLAEHPEIELLEVQGHTDEHGGPALNRKLGQDRAASVVTWLIAHGVDRYRLAARGYGSDQPIADNSTEEGRAKNRRVAFRVQRVKETKAPEPKDGEAASPPKDGGAAPDGGGK